MLLFLPEIPRCSKKPSYSLILAEFRLYNILQESVNKSMDFIEPGSMTVLKKTPVLPGVPVAFFSYVGTTQIRYQGMFSDLFYETPFCEASEINT
jgi:hypothetical protein